MNKRKKLNNFVQIMIRLFWRMCIILALISIPLAEYSDTDEQQIFFGILMFVCVGIVILICSMDGKYYDLEKTKKVKSIKINFDNYDEIVSELSNGLDYKKNNIKIDDNINGIIFSDVKKSLIYGKKMSYIVLVNIEEFSKKTFEQIINATGKWFDENTDDVYYHNYIENTVIMCIEKNNKDFLNFINTGIMQINTFMKLPIGIVLKDKEMYIANNKGSRYKKKYNKMKTRILNILKK